MSITYKRCSNCRVNLAMRVVDKKAPSEYSKAPEQLVGNWFFPSRTHPDGLCVYCHTKKEKEDEV